MNDRIFLILAMKIKVWYNLVTILTTETLKTFNEINTMIEVYQLFFNTNL